MPFLGHAFLRLLDAQPNAMCFPIISSGERFRFGFSRLARLRKIARKTGCPALFFGCPAQSCATFTCGKLLLDTCCCLGKPVVKQERVLKCWRCIVSSIVRGCHVLGMLAPMVRASPRKSMKERHVPAQKHELVDGLRLARSNFKYLRRWRQQVVLRCNILCRSD